MSSDIFSQINYGMILLVKITEEHTGSLPTTFKCAYKCLICTPEGPSGDPEAGAITPSFEGTVMTITDPPSNDRYIIGLNFRNNRLVLNTYMLAFRVGDYYLLDNQNCFMEAL